MFSYQNIRMREQRWKENLAVVSHLPSRVLLQATVSSPSSSLFDSLRDTLAFLRASCAFTLSQTPKKGMIQSRQPTNLWLTGKTVPQPKLQVPQTPQRPHQGSQWADTGRTGTIDSHTTIAHLASSHTPMLSRIHAFWPFTGPALACGKCSVSLHTSRILEQNNLTWSAN